MYVVLGQMHVAAYTEVYFKVLLSCGNSTKYFVIMYNPRCPEGYAYHAQRMLRENKLYSIKKYLYIMGQILDYLNKFKKEKGGVFI